MKLPLASVVVLVLFFSSLALGGVPRGDYGDAPDGTDAYPGVPAKFPTLYTSSSGLVGIHILHPGEETIGLSVSAELNANDPSDPDGVPNLVDNDLDDPIYTQILATSIPAKARLSFKVRVDKNAPDVPRYINVLVDFDKNGSWGGNSSGVEWVVKNQKVHVPVGSVKLVHTKWFNWGNGMVIPTPVWVRVLLSRDPISTDEWKGEGEFDYGEVQDFIVDLKVGNKRKTNPKPSRNLTKKPVCGNNKREGKEECDGNDDKKCPGKCQKNCVCKKSKGPGQAPPGNPGPKFGPCEVPINYYALIINAGDNERRLAGMEAADDIWNTLAAQGYANIVYLGPYWDPLADGPSTISGIHSAIEEIKKKIKCVDRLFVYVVGHGLKKNGHLYGRKWPSGGIVLQGRKGQGEILTPEKLDELLSLISPCKDQNCETKGVTCHMSIVIDSCHSGNFDILEREGRNVALSCASSETAAFGKDEKGQWHGGDYTNGFVKDMWSPKTADVNKDGIVSAKEAHDSAKSKLSIAASSGKAQTPSFYGGECKCSLICGAKCGNGKVEKGEECDYNATPTGCESPEICNEECVCVATQNPPTENTTECPEGEYKKDECEQRREPYDRCVIDEKTNCWYCEEPRTCEDLGMFSTKSGCDSDCVPPDYCKYSEDYKCWYCVDVTCGDGLYESSDCNGECSGQCELYQGGPCYWCVCPDLYVKSIHAHVSKSASTHCQNEVCTTECTLDATVDFKIKNSGTGSASDSTAFVEALPGVGEKTESVGALDPGAETSTITSTFHKSAVVSGSGTAACSELEWWSDTYTARVTADSEGAVEECDEGNNVNSATTQ